MRTVNTYEISSTARTTRGLTFIETIVWIGIFTMAMVAVVSSLLSFYSTNTYTLEQAQAVSDARRGIDQTVAFIREASLASDGAYPVISIGEHEFAFYSDIDDDPLIERVRFFLDGTKLQRGVVDPSGSPLSYDESTEVVSTVSQNVRNLEQDVTTFRYYDEEGDEITPPDGVSDTRFITIDLVVNVSPDQLPNELTISSSATLRNLR